MTSIIGFAEHFEAKISEAIAEVAQFAADEIRRTTPANRTETRRAVFYRARGRRAVVGLRFSKRYPAVGTTTQNLLIRQQQAMKPKLQKRLIDSINRKLQGEE